MKYKSLLFAILFCIQSGFATQSTSLTQYGITWTFNGTYETGQFANGDYWVVGPLAIQSVSPAPGGGQNGSMVNPVAGAQAFDNAAYAYNSSLGISFPYSMKENESMISSISGDVGKQYLKTAAVLTCLATAPPAGTFRPPYCGTDKPLYNVSQLRTELLPNLPAEPLAEPLSQVVANFNGPWLNFLNHYKSFNILPSDHAPWYGQRLALQIGEGVLQLLLLGLAVR